MDHPVPWEFLQLCNDKHGFPTQSVRAYWSIMIICREPLSTPTILDSAINITPLNTPKGKNARDPPTKKPCKIPPRTALPNSLPLQGTLFPPDPTHGQSTHLIFPRQNTAGCIIPGIDCWIRATLFVFSPIVTTEDLIWLSPSLHDRKQIPFTGKDLTRADLACSLSFLMFSANYSCDCLY